MPSNRPLRQRLVVALAATAWVAFPAASVAQDREDGSIGQSAADTVRSAANSALNSARDLTSVALDMIGIHYKWGGTSPETGLDCSGLVQYVFQQVTGVVLPRTARDMSRLGEQVAIRDLKPGDLVFFNTRHFAFSHVGIYLGDNRFVHAPRRGRDVEVAALDSSFWQKRFNGARRMVGILPDLIPAIVTDAAAMPFDARPAPDRFVTSLLLPAPVPLISVPSSEAPLE